MFNGFIERSIAKWNKALLFSDKISIPVVHY